jgi:hypothetical protein
MPGMFFGHEFLRSHCHNDAQPKISFIADSIVFIIDYIALTRLKVHRPIDGL